MVSNAAGRALWAQGILWTLALCGLLLFDPPGGNIVYTSCIFLFVFSCVLFYENTFIFEGLSSRLSFDRLAQYQQFCKNEVAVVWAGRYLHFDVFCD